MRQNVTVGAHFPKWTNNNCESINHVLKQSIGWKPQQIPVLIDTIRELVDGQDRDADRALCGLGNYALRSTHARRGVSVDDWRKLTASQRHAKPDTSFKINTQVSGLFNQRNHHGSNYTRKWEKAQPAQEATECPYDNSEETQAGILFRIRLGLLSI